MHNIVVGLITRRWFRFAQRPLPFKCPRDGDLGGRSYTFAFFHRVCYMFNRPQHSFEFLLTDSLQATLANSRKLTTIAMARLSSSSTDVSTRPVSSLLATTFNFEISRSGLSSCCLLVNLATLSLRPALVLWTTRRLDESMLLERSLASSTRHCIL